MRDLLTFENGYSPLLSLLTGAIEIALMIRALTSRGRRRILWPIAGVLLCLATYQFLEILVCANPEENVWVRLAFVDVVWLPAISVWLLYQYAAHDRRRARIGGQAALVIAAGLCVLVVVDPTFVTGTVCSVVFATFEQGPGFRLVYGALYEVGLFVTIFGGICAIVTLEDPVAKRHTADLVMGTLGFMLPAFITQLMLRQIDPSMPSLMCHYALIMALMLWRTIARERRHAAGS